MQFGEHSTISCSWDEVRETFWYVAAEDLSGKEIRNLFEENNLDIAAWLESWFDGPSVEEPSDDVDFSFPEAAEGEYFDLAFLVDESSSPRPPPWGIRFTSTFRHDLKQLDRKLQGRVLETILEVTKFALPFKVLGDTFKPLQGELKGQWRYRIGDHRLVLKPLEDLAEIELITFAARGSVYD